MRRSRHGSHTARHSWRFSFLSPETWIALATVALALGPAPGLSQDTPPIAPSLCSLDCENNGVCQKGDATFPSSLLNVQSISVSSSWSSSSSSSSSASDLIVPFLRLTSNAGGEHCWCPGNWTGYDCSHQYEYCWYTLNDDDGSVRDGFACFYGGTCQRFADLIGEDDDPGFDMGSNDYYCDCTTTSLPDGTDQGLFAGLHCEHASTAVCVASEGELKGAPVGFCVNGGTCKPNELQQARMCQCPPEWIGPHCEYYVGDKASTAVATTPSTDPPEKHEECDLACSNGGVCQKGSATFPDFLRLSTEGRVVPFLQRTASSAREYCWCMLGWTGYDCSHQYQFCWEKPAGDDTWGDGFACFHGGTCKHVAGGDPTNYVCDCASASWPNGDRRGLFAGAHCEYVATAICREEGNDAWIGFCVNGGMCVDGETNQENMCDCPSEWTGPHCEYFQGKSVSVVPSTTTAAPKTEVTKPATSDECDLVCANNGVCQKGKASLPHNLRLSANNAVVSFMQQTSQNGEYCWCPEGWTGYDCTHEYKYCWEKPNEDGSWGAGFACFHGGTCKPKPFGGPTDFICDCTTSSWPNGSYKGLFAGAHCEHISSDICKPPGSIDGSWIGFCVNGGTCVENVSQQSGMCACPPDWNGPHCEFYNGTDSITVTTTTTIASNIDEGPEPEDNCVVECFNGGACQKGSASFPGNLKTSVDGESIAFLEQTSNSVGEYCWCPNGWTGYDCAHRYQYCWEKPNGNGSFDEGFACFHGGTCDSVVIEVDGSSLNDTFCDCTTADWGGFEKGLFAGRHCEFKATELCTSPGEEKWVGFCVNDGTCKDGATDQSNMCICPPQWGGLHCDVPKKELSVSTTTPQPSQACSLICLHGGTCQKGSADFGFLDDVFEDKYPVSFLQNKTNSNGESCRCPKGWTGYDCQHEFQFCWESVGDNGFVKDGFACFHGAECVNDSGNEDDVSAWRCNCSTAQLNGGDIGMFAGEHCELRATEECLSSDSLQTIGFCVNGGTCIEGITDQNKMCQCKSGWGGPHCEESLTSSDEKGLSQRPKPDQGCDLKCANDGVCQNGDADFGPISPFRYNYTSPIYFLEKTSNDNGQYCWCPPGSTGLQCQHKFEVCDPNNADEASRGFSCFHSSTCTNLGVGNLATWACDCSTANMDGVNEELFAGRYCEHMATQICEDKGDKDGLSEQEWFCVNGGTCTKGETNPYEICQCPSGWTGPHCEYAQKSIASTQFEANKCTLDCRNGGTCVFGMKDYGDQAVVNEAKMVAGLSEKHQDGMHCVCPDGHTGLLCQIAASRCGQRLWCYNGSDCKKTELKDGTVKKYCDCSAAASEEASFAGIGCQHKSGVFCDPDSGMTQQMSFCVNGGDCFETGDGHLGCDCPQDWQGQHCEFHKSESPEYSDPNKCKLECKNGGKCSPGVKDFGTAGKFDLPFLNEQHMNFEHCTCPAGYTGLDCSIRLDVCDDDFVCAYGSTCSVKGTDGFGRKKFECDCERAKSIHGNSVAGVHCQYEATEYCVLGMTARFSFCTNGGRCIKMIESNEKHPGCICPSGWTGERCEFPQTKATEASSIQTPSANHDAGQNKRAALLFSMMFLVIAVIIIVAVVLTKKYATVEAMQREEMKKQQRSEDTNKRGDAFDAEGEFSGQQSGENGEGNMSDVDIL